MNDQAKMTDRELQEIEERAAAANPGPWRHLGELTHAVVLTTGQVVARVNEAPDARFIAASREDIQRLLAEVRRLRRTIEG